MLTYHSRAIRILMTKRACGWWPRIQRIWITTGISATVVFVTWSLLAYRASGPARDALVSDDRVEVTRGAHHWTFQAREGAPRIGLLFYPGALVNPVAYAPLLRAVAAAGFPAVLVQVPRRAALGGAEGAEPLIRGIDATRTLDGVGSWVVAGHSRGGEIASRLARTNAPRSSGSRSSAHRTPAISASRPVVCR